MITSSNQLQNTEFKLGEEKYTIHPDIYSVNVKIYILDTLIEPYLRVVNISKFGIKFYSEDSSIGLRKGDYVNLELHNNNTPVSSQINGVIVYEDFMDGKYFYGVSFDQSIEINSITSLIESIHSIGNLLSKKDTDEIHPKTIEFVRNYVHIISKLYEEVEALEKSLSMNQYENSFGNIHESVIEIIFNNMRDFLNTIKTDINHLFDVIDEKNRDKNFGYILRYFYPILVNEPLSKRSIEQPYGYAGDFEMMQCIYRSTIEGANIFGKILHKWILGFDSSECVYNRKEYFYSILKSKLENSDIKKFKVLSVACGPASEIVELIKKCPQELLNKLDVNLLDQDSRAITEAKHNIRVALLKAKKNLTVNFINKELARALVTLNKSGVKDFNFIYSAGLFDYIKQTTAEKISQRLFNLLNLGGDMFLGNFSIESLEKGYMEMIKWSLIYRTDSEIMSFGNLLPQGNPCEVVTSIHHQKFFKVKKLSS